MHVTYCETINYFAFLIFILQVLTIITILLKKSHYKCNFSRRVGGKKATEK